MKGDDGSVYRAGAERGMRVWRKSLNLKQYTFVLFHNVVDTVRKLYLFLFSRIVHSFFNLCMIIDDQ